MLMVFNVLFLHVQIAIIKDFMIISLYNFLKIIQKDLIIQYLTYFLLIHL